MPLGYNGSSSRPTLNLHRPGRGSLPARRHGPGTRTRPSRGCASPRTTHRALRVLLPRRCCWPASSTSTQQAVERAPDRPGSTSPRCRGIFGASASSSTAIARLRTLRRWPRGERSRSCTCRGWRLSQKFKQWAAHAPMNHQHLYQLLEAERHRVLGRAGGHRCTTSRPSPRPSSNQLPRTRRPSLRAGRAVLPRARRRATRPGLPQEAR